MSRWEYEHDPHGIVPAGFAVLGQYEVVGFCAPAGLAPCRLMAQIRYPGAAGGHSTTRAYLHVLRDFLGRATVADVNDLLSRPRL